MLLSYNSLVTVALWLFVNIKWESHKSQKSKSQKKAQGTKKSTMSLNWVEWLALDLQATLDQLRLQND